MTEADATAQESAYAHCESLIRTYDYDRWLAALFAPPGKRPHLHAIYAFSAEIARVADSVTEPHLGEIRLQWWREALEGAREEAGAHPAVSALRGTMGRFHLPLQPFLDLIDARTFDLWRDPVPDVAWLEGYCGETASALVRLASLILADGRDPADADAAGHAGVAWALTGVMRALPWSAARGQNYIPIDLLRRHGADPSLVAQKNATPALRDALADLRDLARFHLARSGEELAGVDEACRPAYVVLGLVRPYLARMEKRGYEPLSTRIDLPRWRKILAMRRRARAF